MLPSPAAPPRRLFHVAGALLALGVAVLGCSRSSAPPAKDAEEVGPVWFQDVTDAVGLNFVHDAGPTGTYLMPQSMGSGCAFLDFDGDGRLDIYLLHHGGPAGKKNQL